MEIILLFYVFAVFSTAAKIIEHPQSIEVTEGMWANFTCGITLPGYIKWRIGDFNGGSTFYSSGDLYHLEGVTADIISFTNNIFTETISVLAATDRDGLAVQCMFQHPIKLSKNSYSKFALLNVNTTHETTGSGTSLLYPDDIDGKTC